MLENCFDACGHYWQKAQEDVAGIFVIDVGVLGLNILLIEDEAATARTLALRTPVQTSQQRFGNVSRLTPKVLAVPGLTLVHDRQKRGVTKYGWRQR